MALDIWDYAEDRADAEEMIAEAGQVGAIRRTTSAGPAYDPVQSTQDHACTLVDLDYDEKHIDGTLIMRGDRMVYLSTAGLSITPELADKIIIGGVPHAIQNIMPLSPGGTVVFWQIQARR